MRLTPFSLALASLLLPSGIAMSQSAGSPTFDVASVKSSQRLVGPDENNQLSFEPSGLIGKNVTLKRLVAEAYHLQMNQVLGPAWFEQNEYDIEAKADGSRTKDQLAQMLRALLAERFNLSQHSESRSVRVYELVSDKGGPKIRTLSEGAQPAVSGGLHFRGDLQRFADLLAIQLSIPTFDDPRRPGLASGPPLPVLDKTGLTGIYDFEVEIKPEAGSDMFTLWQRELRTRLGLRIESRRAKVNVLVVDGAEKTPTAN